MLSAYVGDVIRLDRKALRLFVFVTYVIIMVLLLGIITMFTTHYHCRNRIT